MMKLLKKIIHQPVFTKLRKLPCYIFYFCPVKENKVLFINFYGRGFGGDPKYICLEILKQNLKLDLVWALDDIKNKMPKKVRKVKKRSLNFYYEMATSKIIIINTTGGVISYYLKKKKGQFILQTWHGSHGFKYIEQEVANKLDKAYVQASRETVQLIDAFVSDGEENTQMYRRAFCCNCPIIETGMPREDILFSDDKDALLNIRKSIGVNENKKVVLYAPTFRDNGAMDAYDVDFSKLLIALKKKFGGEWVALLRLHPNVADKNIKRYSQNNDIINVSDYGDAQELIAISNVLITDYSSIYHDFFVSNKPVFLYTKDIKEYIKEDRPLKPNYFTLGLRHNITMESLLNDIASFNRQSYNQLLIRYKKETGAIADGEASYRVVEYLKNKGVLKS